jgi:class 3 adenylate cyclase
VEPPETRYATTSDGVYIAYQVLGDGPVDFVYAAPWVTHIEYRWELPEYASYLRRIASFSRLILFDRRGLGMSDPIDPEHLPDLETRMVDLTAVIDAVGSERAVIYGASESGSLATLFAASHPERTLALVLHGAYPSGAWEPDAPWGYTADYFADRLAMINRAWGTEEYARWEFPTFTDERLIRWWASYMRRSASPGAVLAWDRMDYATDVRNVLGAIHVPTLILHREEDAPEANRYLADHIPGARYVALPGREHVPYVGDQDSVLNEIEAFVRSIRDEVAELDRVLATVLFTDIVDSTAQAAALGDVAWTKTRAEHDAIVRAHLARYRGREIKTMGDGFLAMFDGPARGVRCAEAIANAVRALGIEIRAGVHTGEIAIEGDDVAGLGVAIGARVGTKAGASEVLVSQTVKDLVAGSGLTFEDAGEHELKGVPDRWRLYRVVS